MKLKHNIQGHARKIAIILLNLFFNNKLSLYCIGLINKRFKLIKTIFVAYPATEKYALAYAYPKNRERMRWKPWPVGVFKQNGSWGIATVISSTERDFISNNQQSLSRLFENTSALKDKTGAEQVTFAGILPGVMSKHNIRKSEVEANVTVEAVLKSLQLLLESDRTLVYENLILLGSKGFIGSALLDRISTSEILRPYFSKESIYGIDLHNRNKFPFHLKGSPTILINLTRKSALLQYADSFWKELTILNEVYPAPNPRELKILSEKQSDIFHIVGLVAKSYPSFPKDYKGGIPCCAGWDSKGIEVIVRKLN